MSKHKQHAGQATGKAADAAQPAPLPPPAPPRKNLPLLILSLVLCLLWLGGLVVIALVS